MRECFNALQKPLNVALDEALRNPELVEMTDYGKTQRHLSLHLAFQALHRFTQKYSRTPQPRSQVSHTMTALC